MFLMRVTIVCSLLLAACASERKVSDCGRCPAAPQGYIDDQARVLSADTVDKLAGQLAAFERDTGVRFALHVAPALPNGVVLEEHTLACANCWYAVQPEKKDQVAVFLFLKERGVQIEVSRHFEARLTNQECRRVIDEHFIPRFRNGDFGGGLSSGLAALMQAARE